MRATDATAELVTGREAALVLAAVLPVREHARLVLAAGFAGVGRRTSGSVLYDLTAVRDLARWPELTGDELAGACPDGVQVARLSRSAVLDVTQAWRTVADSVAVQPAMTPMTRALLNVRIAASGSVPWVATLCGYVALSASCVGVHTRADGRTAFALEPPGAWAEVLERRRLPTRRGTPGCFLWPPEVSARAGP